MASQALEIACAATSTVFGIAIVLSLMSKTPWKLTFGLHMQENEVLRT